MKGVKIAQTPNINIDPVTLDIMSIMTMSE